MADHAAARDTGVRALAFLATLAAGAALACVVAWWVWQIAAPAPVHVLPAAPQDPAGTIIGARLFGGRAAPEATAAAPAADTLGDIHLLGVLARRDGSGEALFRVPAGPVFVASGRDIVPGVQLRAVDADGVTVRDATGEHRLVLPPLASGPARPGASESSALPNIAMSNVAPARPAAFARARRQASSACDPPAGFRGEVVRLNVELVGGLIAQPEVWRAMVQPVAGALVVRETAGFAQMVGLQQGDRIEQANGIALTAPDDVVRAVLQPLASNQPVRLTGTRNGQRRELWIENAACGR